VIPNQGVAFAHEPWRTTTGVSYYQRLYDYALDEIRRPEHDRAIRAGRVRLCSL